MLGVIGWEEFRQSSAFWKKNKKLLNGLYASSLVINIVLLPFISTFYTKEARVESMTYLSHDDNIHFLLLEDSNHSRIRLAPRFYLNHWIPIYEITTEEPLENFLKYHPERITINKPQYVLFFEEENLEKRVNQLRTIYPKLDYVKTIDQGFIDDLLHRMNPANNVNQVIFIYKVG
jgi:hypothetical protein